LTKIQANEKAMLSEHPDAKTQFLMWLMEIVQISLVADLLRNSLPNMTQLLQIETIYGPERLGDIPYLGY
jgi:hypothetical protein